MKILKNKVILTGNAVNAVASSEMPRHKAPLLTTKGKVTHVEMDKIIPGASVVSTSCLAAAAQDYHISPDIRDYNFALIPILVSEIPNVNMQALPTQELLRFLPEYGCQSYKTFVGKCLFNEHANDDVTKSRGIILDASLLPIKKYGIARLMILAAYDRSKDAKMAKNCLNPNQSYSMGCACYKLQCSICGGLQGPAIPRTCTCYDTNFNDLASYGKIKHGDLHYMRGLAPVFFEASQVAVPADCTAQGEAL